MKILIYQPRASYYVGGGEVVAINQAIHLIKNGHDIIFVSTKADWLIESDMFKKFKSDYLNNVFQFMIPEKIKYIYDKKPGHDWIRWDLESVHVSLIAKIFIEKIDYDIAICHLPLDLIGLNPSLKNIVYLHGYPSTLNYACNILLDNQQNFIAVSETVKNFWNGMIENKAINVVYNGVDTEYFSPDSNERKEYDFLFVGRLIESKGVMNLLKAFKQMLTRNGELKLAIVGAGPLEVEINRFVVENNLNSNVNVLGYLNDFELLKMYHKSKIAVLPSLGKEGVLTTALEATACGLPVITSNNSSLIEYIVEGENGLLVNSNNVLEISQSMETLINNPEMLVKMSKNARLMSSGWNWVESIKKLEQFLI